MWIVCKPKSFRGDKWVGEKRKLHMQLLQCFEKITNEHF